MLSWKITPKVQEELKNNLNIHFQIIYKDILDQNEILKLINRVLDLFQNKDLGISEPNWSQKDAVFQGYEISYMKPFTLGDTDLYLTLSRDDISATFDNDTYVPRIPSAKNVLDLTILGQKNETYVISLIFSESQKDFSSIETETNSYVDLAMKYSNKIAISSNYDLNVNLFGNNLLDRTRRNHASFVKAHVPLPASSFGFDVSLDYKF